MNKKSWLNVAKIGVSIALAVVLLYFVFKGVDFKLFVDKLDKVNYAWVLLSLLLSVPIYFFRAYRWRLQYHPLGYFPKISEVYSATILGYLANLLLPRLGEVSRCAYLNKKSKIPLFISFGTVITERIVDVISLLAVIFLTFVFQTDPLLSFLNQTLDTDFNWKIILIVGLLAVGLGLFVFFKIIYKSEKKIGKMARNLVAGVLSLQKVKILPFLLLTCLIWICYFFVTYVTVFALPETAHLHWEVGLSLLSAGVIAFVLPVQSGFGTFHALVSAMLIFYGIDKTTGIFLASLLHTSQLLVVIGLGIWVGIQNIFSRTTNENK